MKIAIATNDGVNVNEHFGKAKVFEVYELQNSGYTKLGKRILERSYCNSEELLVNDNNHQFSGSQFDLVYEAIKDCDIVYTNKIGDTPNAKLSEKGITALNYKGQIKNLLEKELS